MIKQKWLAPIAQLLVASVYAELASRLGEYIDARIASNVLAVRISLHSPPNPQHRPFYMSESGGLAAATEEVDGPLRIEMTQGTLRSLSKMGMENYTRHQQSIIKRFYDNRDNIALQRAQELVTELYLTEGKKRLKVWETLAKNLEKLEFTTEQIARLQKEDKPELVAKLLETKL